MGQQSQDGISKYVVSNNANYSVDDVVDYKGFRYLLENPRPHGIRSLPDRVAYIPAVLNDTKTGGLTRFETTDTEILSKYSSYFETMGLHHKIDIFPSYSRSFFYYTKDKKILDSIDVDVEDEAYGQFLGVPEKDNEWYEESDVPSIDEATPVLEYLNMQDMENIQYARLVSWICRPTQEGLRRTIQIGKEIYQLSELLYNEYNYELPIEWCEKRIDWSDSWY